MIEDAPYDVKVTADPMEFVKGQPLVLRCSAEANPPPQYSWKKNGAQLQSNPRIIFSSLEYSDSGTYECMVKNSLGSVSKKFVVIVDGMLRYSC